MDEGLGDEVAPVDVVEGAHLRNKESEYTLKPPESSNILESREMVIPVEADYPESSFHVFADMLEGKNVNMSVSPVDASEQPCPSPRYMDDAGNMVEELTVRNYDGSNLAIVGTSNKRERMQTRQSQWQHLYQIGGGLGNGSSHGNTLCRDNGQAMRDSRYASSSEFLIQKTSSNDQNEVMEQLANAEYKEASGSLISHASIRTKILSKSGFSEFFVKNTLKGKGIIFRGPPHDGMRFESKDHNNGKAAGGTSVASNAAPRLSVKTAMPSSFGFAGLRSGGSNHDGVSLREWLNARQHKVSKAECLHIFRRIVDLVDYSHSQGVALPELRPSCFKLLRSNQVKYLGSAVRREMLGSAMDQDIPSSENRVIRRRPLEQGMLPSVAVFEKKQKFSENMIYTMRWPQLTTKYGFKLESANDGDINAFSSQDSRNRLNEHKPNAEYGIQVNSSSHQLSNTGQQQVTPIIDRMESKWYTSPEELSEGICTISSNIYSLGILLFEVRRDYSISVLVSLKFYHGFYDIACPKLCDKYC